jgi:hypothetical protein
LNDKIEKKIKKIKNNSSQLKLTRQTLFPSHETEITK